jgi:hypothetical protein
MHLEMKKTCKGLIAFSFSLFLPAIFLTFDSHHDGLILSTVRLTKESLASGTTLPFNQYGPGWSILEALITWPIPFKYLMLTLRLLTLAIYALTGFLLFIVGRKVYSELTGLIAVFIYFLSQPFVSTYKSGFMSWPSVYASPAILLIIYLWLIRIEGHNKQKHTVIDICISSIAFFLLLTRAQIGILAIAFLSFLYLRKFGKQHLLIFCSFLTILITLAVSATMLSPIFSYSLKDEFIYGALHASSDLGFRIPIFSLIGASAWLVSFFVIKRMILSGFTLTKRYFIYLAVVFSTIILLFVKISENRNLDSFSLMSTIQRRFWVSLFLGFILLSLFQIMVLLRISRVGTTRNHEMDILILGFSLVAYSQTYPLFDQMHSWWGACPVILIIANEVTKKLTNSEVKFAKLLSIGALTLLSLNLALILDSTTSSRTKLPATQLAFIYENSANASLVRGVSDFLSSNISEGTKVQNLCSDANVFLLDKKMKTSTHLTVFWDNFPETPYMNGVISVSDNTYIVDCLGLVEKKSKFLKIVEAKIHKQASYKDPLGRNWVVYKYG